MMGLFILLIKKEVMDEEEFIIRYATVCRRCNINFVLEYENEFTCYVCEFNVAQAKKINYRKYKKRRILILMVDYHANFRK